MFSEPLIGFADNRITVTTSGKNKIIDVVVTC